VAFGAFVVGEAALGGQDEAEPEPQVRVGDAVEALPGALRVGDGDRELPLEQPQVAEQFEHLADP
jgi:hypothetical protein